MSELNLSRRGLFRGALLIAGGGAVASAVLSSGGAGAQTPKRTQKLVAYQDTPKGRARCDNCSAWQAPAACKLVQGTIKPSGWCIAYAPNS